VTPRRGHPKYYELIEKMQAIHNAKNSDYASDGDPLSNLRMAERFGVPAWKGALIRMSDKWSRLEQLAGGKEAAVKDESVEDTLLDLANYALLCIVLRQEVKA
jgi:hypothetical protein